MKAVYDTNVLWNVLDRKVDVHLPGTDLDNPDLDKRVEEAYSTLEKELETKITPTVYEETEKLTEEYFKNQPESRKIKSKAKEKLEEVEPKKDTIRKVKNLFDEIKNDLWRGEKGQVYSLKDFWRKYPGTYDRDIVAEAAEVTENGDYFVTYDGHFRRYRGKIEEWTNVRVATPLEAAKEANLEVTQ